MLKFTLFALMAVLGISQTVISPNRYTDWTQAGVAGGIPTRTTQCSTLNPGATAGQINSAIAACPANQVVFLNAGTYNLSAGIVFNGKSNVTLRGAGPDRTFLVFSNGDSCMGQGGDICVNGNDLSYYIESPSHTANWTAGYAKNATQLTLSTTSGLAPGMVVILDQLNDTSDTSAVYVCSTANVCANEGPGGGGRTNREQEQFAKVVSIAGNVVTITPGLHMPNWRSGQSPQVSWGNANAYVSGVGLENFSVDHAKSKNGKAGIYFIFANNSWVKNVRSLNANRNHVWLYESLRCTVRDSYFYGTQNAASQSYGVEEFMASDNLVENNILHHIATPLQTNEGTGTVFGYNFTTDDYYNVSPTWQQASSYLHAAGTDMILHEGNVGTGFTGDVVHGTHNFVTGARNYWIGVETGKAAQTIPILLYSFNRYMNFVGNVLGKAGYHTNYESFVPSLNSPDTSIYRLGSGDGNPGDDTLTRTTMLRWGNYDTVNNAVRFVTSEVPSGLSQFPNTVPSDQTIPTSYYLSAKPSWFGSIPFPPIGPDVTGGNIAGVGGHANKIPAQVCYEAATKLNGIATFNADLCYGNVAPPPPPPPPPPPVISVSVTPATVTMQPAGTQQFTPVLVNTTQGVTWSISPVGAGSISGTGLYTASSPTTLQNVTIKATSVEDPTKFGTAVATVAAVPPPPPPPTVLCTGTITIQSSNGVVSGICK